MISLYDGIMELQDACENRRKGATFLKDYELMSVATCQIDMMKVAEYLIKYTLMLNDRNTLEVEGFLITKIDYCIKVLENTKGRINLARSIDELI